MPKVLFYWWHNLKLHLLNLLSMRIGSEFAFTTSNLRIHDQCFKSDTENLRTPLPRISKEWYIQVTHFSTFKCNRWLNSNQCLYTKTRMHHSESFKLKRPYIYALHNVKSYFSKFSLPCLEKNLIMVLKKKSIRTKS
jgi:hypothetical protein